MALPLDASLNRPRDGGVSYPLRHRLLRFVWGGVWGLLGATSPTPFFGWRRFLLRLFGAQIAASAKVYPSVRIWYPPNLEMAEWSCMAPRVNCYSMAPIRLGAYALVSQGAHLCAGTHDIDDPNFQLVVKPVTVEANAWVAAEAFVGPGVTVGAGAVLGARSVLFRDLAPLAVAAGNPAQTIRQRRVDRNAIG